MEVDSYVDVLQNVGAEGRVAALHGEGYFKGKGKVQVTSVVYIHKEAVAPVARTQTTNGISKDIEEKEIGKGKFQRLQEKARELLLQRRIQRKRLKRQEQRKGPNFIESRLDNFATAIRTSERT